MAVGASQSPGHSPWYMTDPAVVTRYTHLPPAAPHVDWFKLALHLGAREGVGEIAQFCNVSVATLRTRGAVQVGQEDKVFV